MELNRCLVLIRGAGDLASGEAARLRRCGFPVVMTELPQPLMVRRTVCFGEAVYQGEMAVEEIIARCVPDVAAARAALAERIIPILVDPPAACRAELLPHVLVDGMMAKRNTGVARTRRSDAPLVIGLGPGFTAGADCHAVIETQRGHWLGRVYWQGPALPDTGVPGEIGGAASATR
ncbi:MAG: xanthine dehydrogenase accessory factor, partial [Chloroflexota bacterium]|nr:xanthine dehydrogenase accessory factor [Chloroflexota bacterium]